MECIAFYRKSTLGMLSSIAFLACVWAPMAFSAEPSRKWTVYLLPHSHVDIGYTHLQPEVEQKQMNNLDIALELCRKTADYPPEARFKWNTEVAWPVDCYLRKSSPEKQQQLLDAIRAGQIELDALYGNELTGLCRPEELTRLCDISQQIAKRCGVKVESAMISDVPGYTWGLASVFGQVGVKYFSIGPNICDRIGYTLALWQDKPFYWVSPDGLHKTLCWIPLKGYALGFVGFKLDQQLLDHLAQLEKQNYPYDMVQLRWAVGSDNGPPDAALPDAVKQWNATHPSVQLVIATTSQLFREFENRYAGKIPEFRGDWTPFWEDGAASSARETAANRDAAERLVQAQSLFAMIDSARAKYPASRFQDAWRNAILYDEHTWGAYNSVNEPDAPFVKKQWAIKQAFAVDAWCESKVLLKEAFVGRGALADSAVDVFNTSSWTRTDLVTIPKEAAKGDVVQDTNGRVVPSQRLSTGELVLMAQEIPAMAGRRYTIRQGDAAKTGDAVAKNNSLSSGDLTLKIDSTTGAIASFKKGNQEFVDSKTAIGLNQYVYLPEANLKDAKTNGPSQIRVLDAGPLVASLEITSDAPGCNRLVRQIRVISGLDRVEISNVVDKKAIRQKEGVHFGFGFLVPNAVVRMDIPWTVVQPEKDQLPGACKNWFTVQRFVDVSNDQCGVTWATLDAPMVEIGGLTANIMAAVHTNPANFLTKIAPSSTIYSWVMNNHWHTNYKADQDGPTQFRYAIRPHKTYDAGAAQRFGIEQSQPLVATPARGDAPQEKSLMTVEPAGVVITSLQPIDSGKHIAVRLFNATGAATTATLRSATAAQQPLAIKMAPWEVVVRNIAAEK